MAESRGIVMITGASAGIGRATARVFAQNGFRPVLIARRQELLEELAGQIARESNQDSQILALDLRNHRELEDHLGRLKPGWRQVDVLVNNAGLARGTDPFYEGQPDDWDEVIDVNVKSLLSLSAIVARWMKSRGAGHIINLGSIAGRETYPGGAVYCASKHAVRALTRGMRMDLLGTPIRISSVDPGLVETEFSQVRFRGDEERARAPYENMEPLRPEDIAEAVYWVASRPPHVNVMDLTIFPTAQASAYHVYRGELG